MALNEYGTIQTIALRNVAQAFRDESTVDEQWRALNYHAEPDFQQALRDYDAFVESLSVHEPGLIFLDGATALTLDALARTQRWTDMQ